MKIYAISDLHLSENNTKPMNIFGPAWDNYIEKIENDWSAKVSDDDVVILAGDYSWAMRLEDVIVDFEFLARQKGKKIIIRGNHDYWWKSLSSVRDALPAGCYALANDAMKLGEYIFCGNRGWIIPEGKDNTAENQKLWARELIRTRLSLEKAKALQTDNEKIIFITHYPPFNSKTEPNDLTRLLSEFGVSKVIFGHLHSYVQKKMYYNEIDGVEYHLTSCDLVGNTLVDIY